MQYHKSVEFADAFKRRFDELRDLAKKAGNLDTEGGHHAALILLIQIHLMPSYLRRLADMANSDRNGASAAKAQVEPHRARAEGTPDGGPTQSHPPITRDEANLKARELLESDPSLRHKTQEEWAKAIGCSSGLVNKLPVWRAVMEETGRGRTDKPFKTARPPKVVALSDKMETVTGEDNDPSSTADTDAVMRKLMEAASPEKRAELNDLTPEQRQELAKAYAEHEADTEPSPLEDDLPLKRPKKVRTRKRL